jgi:hypothetical protein
VAAAPWRFSLRGLLLVAGVAISLGVGRWYPPYGIAAGLALPGLFLVRTGKRSQRTGMAAAGVLLVALALLQIGFWNMTEIHWSGTRKLDVYVLVIDASTLTPVPNAKIEALMGPSSPLEGSHASEGQFAAIVLPDGTAPVTDHRGRARFRCGFFASGTDGLFKQSGYVDTKQVWLRVSAPGYAKTYMPVDQQSPRPRDLRDQTPICVTAPVGRIITE